MEHGPAIVIFGAAVRCDGTPSTALLRRVEAAARFGRGLTDPLYVPTGGVGRFGPAEAEVMAALLRACGVDPASILPEDTATDTVSSVRAVRRLLRGHGGAVYAASSAYHLPRCVLLMRLAGLRAYPCPPPPFPASRSFRKRWRWRLRECAALPLDVAMVAILRITKRL